MTALVPQDELYGVVVYPTDTIDKIASELDPHTCTQVVASLMIDLGAARSPAGLLARAHQLIAPLVPVGASPLFPDSEATEWWLGVDNQRTLP